MRFELIYFCISNLAPKLLIIFKNDGDEVFTVSKFLILVFAPVSTAKINADIQILWSPRFFTKTFLLLASKNPLPKIFRLEDENLLFTPTCFRIFCISRIRLLSLFAKSSIPLNMDTPFVKAAITNKIGYSSVAFT